MVLEKPDVKEVMSKFVFIKLWTDKPDPLGSCATKLKVGYFKSAGLPLYIILSPDGNELHRIEGSLLEKQSFIEMLQKVLTQVNDQKSKY